MKKVLLITTQVPYPPNSGGVIKTWRMVEHFSAHFDLTVFALEKPGEAQGKKELELHLPEIKLESVPHFTPRNVLTLMRSYAQGKTINQLRNYNPIAQKRINELAVDQDVIIVDHFEMFQYVDTRAKSKVIFHEHNAEFVLWERYAAVSTHPLKRLLLSIESKRIKSAELSACLHSDMVWAAPDDIKKLEERHQELGEKFKETYHLGEDELLNLPELSFQPEKRDLLFVGTLSWEANIDGLVHFLHHIFPHVLKEVSNCTFHIVGKKADQRIIEAAKPHGENVHIAGFQEDLEPYFLKCAAIVLPLRFGSGMKVKFLNALYRGIPVVTTEVGTESIQVENNQTTLVAHDDAKFAQDCIRIMTDESLWNRISRNSRKLAWEKYQWAPHLRNLTNYISEI